MSPPANTFVTREAESASSPQPASNRFAPRPFSEDAHTARIAQRGLRVAQRHEPTEAEANRVADRLTRHGNSRPHARPASVATRASVPNSTLHPYALGSTPNYAPSETTDHLSQPATQGRPIDAKPKAEFEHKLSANLSDVRVHTDHQAATDAAAIGARAFTHGKDIYFGQNEYRPTSPAGKWLLAHEVAHTQQTNPGVVSRYARNEPLPAPTQDEDQEQDAATPQADAAVISNQLRVDPNDTSGQVARRLDHLPPEERNRAVAQARAKQSPGQPDRVAGAAAPSPLPQPSRDPQAETEPSERPGDAPDSPREHARRNAAATVSPPSHATPSQPRASAPSPPTRTTTASPPGMPSSRASDTLPSPPSPPAPTSAAAGSESTPATETPAAESSSEEKSVDPSSQTEGDQAAGGAPAEDGPPRLADLFQQAPAGAESLAAQPTPASPVLSSAPAVASPTPASDSETTDASAGVSNESAPTPLAFGATIPIALPSGLNADAPQQGAERLETPATDPSVVAAEMEAQAGELESALSQARENLNTTSESVASSVRQKGGAARSGINREIEGAVKSIEAGASDLTADLDRMVIAGHGQIDTVLAARKAEVDQMKTKGRDKISGVFSDHRKTVNKSVKDSIKAANDLRRDKIQSTRRRNNNDISTVYARGEAKRRSYGNSRRGRFIGRAAYSIARGAAKEMRDQMPDILEAVNEITAPLPEHFRTQGAQALDGFDTNLPAILTSVDNGSIETKDELDARAYTAHQQLDEMAEQARGDIQSQLSDALEQVGAFGTEFDNQLNRELGRVLKALKEAPQQVLAQISPLVEEAIDLYRNGQDPDPEAAAQLTDTLLDFIDGSVADTNDKMQDAGDKAQDRFGKMRGSARRAMAAETEKSNKFRESARRKIAETISASIETFDTGLGAVATTFEGSIDATADNIKEQLQPSIDGLDGNFNDVLRQAERDIDARINEGMGKNTQAINSLNGKMNEAASEAAWEYDHPILSTLAFIGGIIAGIVAVLALVVALIVVTILLAKVLAVSALVAGLILVAGMASFAIGYGIGARLAAGQGFGEAFVGSVTDFGRAVPNMLYEMTGIPKLKRAFSDEHMTPYQRGKLVGEGGTEMVLAIFMVRGAAKGIAGRFRNLPRVPPPAAPAASVPARTVPPAPRPTAVATPPPGAAPRPPPATAAPRPAAPPAAASARSGPPRTTSGTTARPSTPSSPQAPSARPVSRPQAPSAAEPPAATTAPAGQPRLRLVHNEPLPPEQLTPPRGQLRSVGGREGPGRPPQTSRRPQAPEEPLPTEPQTQRAQIAAGAEGHEPVIGELPPQPVTSQGGPRLVSSNGRPIAPGGRAPVGPRASASSSGGGGNRPKIGGQTPRVGSTRSSTPRPTATGQGGRPSPSRPRPSQPTAEAPTPQPSASRSSGGRAAPAQSRPSAAGATRPSSSGRRPSRGRATIQQARRQAGERIAEARAKRDAAIEEARGQDISPAERNARIQEIRAKAQRDIEGIRAQRDSAIEAIRSRRARRSATRETKAERARARQRANEAERMQREFQGLENSPQRPPNTIDEAVARDPGTEFSGAQVRRGVSEDLSIAQAAGAEFERPMVRAFAASQPASAETFGSALGNWQALAQRFPRIAQIFSGGSRPDAISVNPRTRTIRLFDPTSRPNASHMDKSISYFERLLEDPLIRQQFEGWKLVVEERYWEAGFKSRRLHRARRIPPSSN